MKERAVRAAKPTCTLKFVDRTTLTAPKVLAPKQVNADAEWAVERGSVAAMGSNKEG